MTSPLLMHTTSMGPSSLGSRAGVGAENSPWAENDGDNDGSNSTRSPAISSSTVLCRSSIKRVGDDDADHAGIAAHAEAASDVCRNDRRDSMNTNDATTAATADADTADTAQDAVDSADFATSVRRTVDAAAARWKAPVLRALPYASLLVSIVGAVIMKRTPQAAWKLVAFAVVGWVLVVVTTLVVRRVRRVQENSKAASIGAFVMVFASQSVLQTSLVFPLPFFLQAAAWPPIAVQVPFWAVYVCALVVSTWDPWYERLAASPIALMSLQAFAAFVALLTAVPLLGVDNGTSFVVAGVVCAVGVPLGMAIFGPRRWRRSASVWAMAALAAVLVGGAPMVPPAPLALMAGVMGTSVEQRVPHGVATTFTAPEQIVCHTAIRAPLGLKDTLVHVWSRDGHEVQRVPLTVSGGVNTGFRTWSKLTSPAPGAFRCRVETARGQVVGDVVAVVQ